MDQDISILGACCGAVVSFLLGGVWYSRFAFGETWAREAGMTADALAQADPRRMVLISFPLALLAAFAFAAFLGESGVVVSAAAGLVAGVCWVGASFGVNYVFEQRSFKLWLVNAGYHTVQFTLIGLCVGTANALG